MSDERRQLDAALRSDLLLFCHKVFEEINPGRQLEPNWHHDAMASVLYRATVTGEIRHAIINVPPRSLKSELASVALPAFLLGRDPTKKIICVSYSQDLANDFSRKTRQVMSSSWYKRLFPSTRIAGQGAETGFRTTRGGGRIATSVGGTLTGRGGDVIIIDDPQKANDVHSEVQRASLYKWVTETLYTRLDDKRVGRILLIQQRLHEDDLSGQLIGTGGWHHLRLPAIAERDEFIPIGGPRPGIHHRREGQLLDPVREGRAILDHARATMGQRAFHAQYLQDPVPEDGDIIKLGWFRRYVSLEDPEQVVISVDTASKGGVRNDYSVFQTWWVIGDEYWLVAQWRRRAEYPELKRELMKLADDIKPHTILIEDKGMGIGLIQELKAEDKYYPVVAYDPGRADKETRMKIQASKIESGRVYIPKDCHWVDEFLAEVRRFPGGAHDDQIDAMSQFLDHMTQNVGSFILAHYRW